MDMAKFSAGQQVRIIRGYRSGEIVTIDFVDHRDGTYRLDDKDWYREFQLEALASESSRRNERELQFSIGDVVKLKRNLEVGREYEGIRWNSRDSHLLGIHGVIENTDSSDRTYRLVGHTGWFGESMFEDPEDEHIENLESEMKALKEEIEQLKQEFSQYMQGQKPQVETTNRKAIHIK